LAHNNVQTFNPSRLTKFYNR